jgi:hypothetical protein
VIATEGEVRPVVRSRHPFLDGAFQMIKFRKSIAAAVAAAGVFSSVAVSQQAAASPLVPGALAATKSEGPVSQVYWRGHGGGWGWWGPGALFGGIVGGALIASAVAEHRADRVDMDRCARDFPEFSYRTGTYIDRRGNERVCPYLR